MHGGAGWDARLNTQLEILGIADRFNDIILRHTYITNLLLAGIDIKTVQYLAGHENSKITLDIYAHLTYNKPEEILKKVQAAFDGNQDREDFSYGKNQE